MKKVLNKKLNDKAMLAGIFAFVSLGVLYFFVSATVNNTQAPTLLDLQVVAPTTSQTQGMENTVNGMKKYRSDRLKIEFEYPEKYTIKQNMQFVSIINPETQEIVFSKSGSMFNDVASHVDDAIKKWYQQPTQRREFISNIQNGLFIEKSISNSPYRIIYFVKDYAVYQFETGDPSFFPDLEVIAKSLKILE